VIAWLQADLYRAAEAAARSVETFGPGEVIGLEGSAMDRLLIVREGSCCMIEVRTVRRITLAPGCDGAPEGDVEPADVQRISLQHKRRPFRSG